MRRIFPSLLVACALGMGCMESHPRDPDDPPVLDEPPRVDPPLPPLPSDAGPPSVPPARPEPPLAPPPPPVGAPPTPIASCRPGEPVALRGVARDFDAMPGATSCREHRADAPESGLVEVRLGPSADPVLAPGSHCTVDNQADFSRWFADAPGVPRTAVELRVENAPGGMVTFGTPEFFPADVLAPPANEYLEHNHDFATELLGYFRYGGGEYLTFTADDDVWVFINGHLALDLGGAHVAITRTLALRDAGARFGLELGGIYEIRVFHVDRGQFHSHLEAEGRFEFVCP